MTYDSFSSYPQKIDPLIYVQDIGIEDADAVSNYRASIAQGKYSDAQTTMNANNNITQYSAELMNMIENRIYVLQQYLIANTVVKNNVYTSDEPTSPTNSEIWIQPQS